MTAETNRPSQSRLARRTPSKPASERLARRAPSKPASERLARRTPSKPASERLARRAPSKLTPEALLDALPVGVVACDAEGTITYSNKAARELWQHPGPEGLKLTEHSRALKLRLPGGGEYPPETLPLTRALREGIRCEGAVVDIDLGDGAVRSVLCHTAPLHDEGGRIVGAVGAFGDVTPLRDSALERAKLQEENRRQREFLTRLFEVVPVGLAVAVGPEYRFILANSVFRDVIARGRGEVLGRTAFEIWPETERYVSIAEGVRLTGIPYSVVDHGGIVWINDTPERRAFSYSVWPIEVSEGDDGLLVVVEETTDKVQAREKADTIAAVAASVGSGLDLKEVLHASLREIVRFVGADDGVVYLVEPDGRHVSGIVELEEAGRVGAVVDLEEWPAIRDVSRAHQPSFVRSSWLVHPPASSVADAFWGSKARGAIVAPMVVGDRCLAMAFINFRKRTHAPPPGDLALVATLADQCALVIDRAKAHEEMARLLVSERKARADAEERYAQMQAIIENLDEGAVVRDPAGRLLVTNRRMREMILATAQESVTLGGLASVISVFGPDGAVLDLERWPMSRILRGETVRDEELVIQRRDGSRITVIANGSPIRDESGQFTLALFTMHDITDLRRLEHAKDEFLQVLAHELRNPLAAAYGLVQLASRKVSPDAKDKTGEHLRLAEAELRRLTDLVNDIITGYRVSSGRLPLDLRLVNLAEIVAKTAEPYSLGLFQSRVIVRAAPRPVIAVLGDAKRLAEVVQNLLSNATKYSPPGSSVEVRIQISGPQVELTVADRGIGIPPDQLEQVFAGFYRATNLTDRQPGGLGLGLYISRDIARRHGGDLWAENREGGGTVMHLVLPLYDVQGGRDGAVPEQGSEL